MICGVVAGRDGAAAHPGCLFVPREGRPRPALKASSTYFKGTKVYGTLPAGLGSSSA
jgi:hypothetical protein